LTPPSPLSGESVEALDQGEGLGAPGDGVGGERVAREMQGSRIIHKSVPATRLLILGTGPEHNGLLWHGRYCHVCVLSTDPNLRSNAGIPSEQTKGGRIVLPLRGAFGGTENEGKALGKAPQRDC
jgi:hypothetical protein